MTPPFFTLFLKTIPTAPKDLVFNKDTEFFAYSLFRAEDSVLKDAASRIWLVWIFAGTENWNVEDILEWKQSIKIQRSSLSSRDFR